MAQTPFSRAFGLTLAAVLFIGADAVGYDLGKHGHESHWVVGPVWWQIAVGAIFGVLAVLQWIRAIRSVSD
jgi:hypothetical protein